MNECKSEGERGFVLEQHGGLWSFINMLAKESGDRDIVGSFVRQTHCIETPISSMKMR